MEHVEEQGREGDHGSIENGEEDLVRCEIAFPSVEQLGSSEDRSVGPGQQVVSFSSWSSPLLPQRDGTRRAD